MNLYRINALYLGKDLDDELTINYIVAKDEDEIFNIMDSQYGLWSEEHDKDFAKRVKKNKGDFDEDYYGEFYDVKYRWEKIGEIKDEEIDVLKKFNIVKS